ncbi:hypothetical protein [Streptacidiphilus monticola]|uniref:Uncharacterized protein n=1 Tax=Streptacidiphilus monticola TaxID=2161674 RepID=A0ABW1G588_9ACTN
MPLWPAAPGATADAGPAVRPKSRKALYVSLAAVGWLVIASGTATAVVAVGSGPRDTPLAAAAGSASPSASATPSAGAGGASPSSSPSAAAPSPSPTSTVHGSVHGSHHSGDLRYFLLPVPDDAAAYGDPDGTAETLSDIAKEMSNSSTSKRILHDYGCTGGAYRTYRTNDGQYTVTTRIIHFDSSSHASDWVSGLSFAKGDSFTVPGVTNGHGQAFDPSQSDGMGELIGYSHVGDIEYEITVDGDGKLPHSLLKPLMIREERRLVSGK